ncbi:PD-(D/E)XK nuclease family protein [Anabaenopsis tanganyikae CS-531]|uniref:PD-(D/E)XK nuclease family protein n=2 Tax=Anabaenopsis TaxID=110103 RepID=A0ABT5AQT8_9CYAN|nr:MULTISPECIES: PD-(D/E)XK nuclease family protein [Anabaenopsis]MDB9539686.1 PD-(D/E)XK nuclease family protein [Anabaenopsis arnoldii]MDH6091991.1 PD-(D/E)XK nuclease family protein [Anabaenopsis arnoldii]MDH6106252.1 PD-(D/E)XK nuclease family protein [Anabaenopsis tanganyikae CS-531]
MSSETTPLLHLSQAHLNLLETCPRKFQQVYLEKLHSPSSPEHQEHQVLGSRFHLLMQQREMGLPIAGFLQADTRLESWISGLTNVAPELLTPTVPLSFREGEHYRTLQIQNYLLTVIYDLLIADADKAHIIDWKTHPQPPNKRKLEQNWQTRLYLYVLAETSAYLPQNISMTYWFVQSEGEPQNIQFNYDNLQHQRTAEKLAQLLNKLTRWLEGYQRNRPFPQVPENSKTCNYCHFAILCQRTQAGGEHQQNLPNLANIQEVTL